MIKTTMDLIKLKFIDTDIDITAVLIDHMNAAITRNAQITAINNNADLYPGYACISVFPNTKKPNVMATKITGIEAHPILEAKESHLPSPLNNLLKRYKHVIYNTKSDIPNIGAANNVLITSV